MKNRSVPTGIILPHLAYRDVAEAIAWLTRVFGFVEHYRYGRPEDPSGAQLHLGDAWIMVHGARPGSRSPAEVGYRTQSLTIFVDDVEAHFERSTAAGATIIEQLRETEYGERQYGVEDLDDHFWLFSQHARDVKPEEWGAVVRSV